MSACAACGADAPPGQRFCGQCGAPLARMCPACGSENPPDHRFCGSCGIALSAGAGPPAGSSMQVSPSAVAERRLVSVLFADLVGFTTLSEHRDPEEVRELLSRYFDRCRVLIERFGGTVEKFIGDAVMAVWGTPVAREDDAERAVRTALALTQAVTLLGEEVGMPTLRARAGVLTGSAAVELGAEGEGMVLGDTVNTASRLQSIAEPGSVLVDDVTRRCSPGPCSSGPGDAMTRRRWRRPAGSTRSSARFAGWRRSTRVAGFRPAGDTLVVAEAGADPVEDVAARLLRPGGRRPRGRRGSPGAPARRRARASRAIDRLARRGELDRRLDPPGRRRRRAAISSAIRSSESSVMLVRQLDAGEHSILPPSVDGASVPRRKREDSLRGSAV